MGMSAACIHLRFVMKEETLKQKLSKVHGHTRVFDVVTVQCIHVTDP